MKFLLTFLCLALCFVGLTSATFAGHPANANGSYNNGFNRGFATGNCGNGYCNNGASFYPSYYYRTYYPQQTFVLTGAAYTYQPPLQALPTYQQPPAVPVPVPAPITYAVPAPLLEVQPCYGFSTQFYNQVYIRSRAYNVNGVHHHH